MPHPTQLLAQDTGLLIIDLQEKLLPKILGAEFVLLNTTYLLDAGQLVQIPVQATEQYPKGLGPSVPEIVQRCAHRPDKTAFSSCAVPTVIDSFRQAKRTKIVVAGIETHVCVLHTTLDLLNAGLSVYIPVDAVGSRYSIDHEYALRRLEKAGAVLTTTEACMFEWVGGASHPQFKALSGLVQKRMQQLS